MFTEEKMKARFKELTAQYDAIKAKSDPIRAKRDALIQKADLEAKALAEKVKEVEAGLFDIEMERARLARALKGKTG